MSFEIFLQINSVNLHSFERKCVSFSKPQLLRLYDFDHGSISVAKKCKYLKFPRRADYPLDLNLGYEDYIYYNIKNEENTMLTLLHTMRKSSSTTGDNTCYEQGERTTVYTGRGELRCIMQFCYSKLNFDNNLCIMRYDGQLFIFQSAVELQEHEKTTEHTHHARLLQHLFVDDPNGLPNLDRPFDENVVQYAVRKCSLGSFDITYACEAQGILSTERNDNCDDFEALNKKQFVIAKQIWSRMRDNDSKFLRYWIQAYLANADSMYVAYKDNLGVVREPIRQITISEMAKNRYWKPDVCTTFLNEFLERVKHLMSDINSLETVYEFNFNVHDRTIKYQIHEGNPDKIVLPKEYLEFLRNKAECENGKHI